MSKSYYDIAQELAPVPNLSFASKGEYAHRVYVEQRRIAHARTPGKLPSDSVAHLRAAIPAECIPGSRHPECDYLFVVDASRTGGDDHHDNWQIVYEVSLLDLAQAYPDDLTFPDSLVNDGMKKTDERQGGGGEETILQWTFVVINPTAYSPPNLYTTTHPRYGYLNLIREDLDRDGPRATVTRTYVKFPTTQLTSADYKNDSVLPPRKFLPSVTLTTLESNEATATAQDTGAGVIEGRVDAIDPARRKKTTVSASYPSIGTLIGSDVDMETGISYSITQQVVAAGTLGSNVASNGLYSTVEPVDTSWSIKTTRKSTTIILRQWEDIINFSWPSVLSSISIFSITSGGLPVRYIVKPNWWRYAYSGPCRALITETWTKTAPSPPNVISLVTTPIVYDGVFFQVSVPPCLHQSYIFSETSGTSNPSYDYFIHVESVSATTFTDWPSSIYGPYSVSPYRGGYLARQTIVFAP